MALPLVDVARIEGRMAEMVGVLNTAVAGVVGVLGEALETGAWQVDGVRSPEHWVTWQTGMAPSRARSLVTMAQRLPDLPVTRAAFERGELSEDQVRLICAVVDPRNDERAADLGRVMTVPQLRKALRPLARRQQPNPDKAKPADPTDTRRVTFGFDDDGRWWLHGLLPGDEGAVVQRALERARDAEFHLRHPDADGNAGADGDDGTTKDSISWADGLLRLAEAALDDLAPAGRPGERFQVLVHVPADGEAAAYLHLGPRIDDTVRRYRTCDATVRYVLEQDGKIVALSSKRDTVDDKTRVIIEDRDGGCLVPGCGQRRWLHIHHIVHREDGGRTVLENLCAICPHHHRMHHAGLLDITGDPTTRQGVTFRTRDGRIIGPAPPRPPGRPPDEAARHVGLPEPTWQHPTGERVDWRWIHWHDN